MFLVAEVVLTVYCWMLGYRWKAVIPVAVVFIIGFVIGFAHLTVNAFTIMAMDGVCITILSVMLGEKARRLKRQSG